MNPTKNSLKIGSESGSAGTFGTGLYGSLHGVVLNSGVTLSADDSYDDDRGLLTVP